MTEYGLEEIEVSDNGTGIDPKDYSTVAKRHHTSKLTTIKDLETVRSFGFRGEVELYLKDNDG